VASSPFVEEENRKAGQITFATYRAYAKAVGPQIQLLLWLLLCIFAQAALLGIDYFLALWVDFSPTQRRRAVNLAIYSILVACFTIGIVARDTIFMMLAAKASAQLNESAFGAVIKAPMSFFHRNPVGRILNRFSKDLGLVDDEFPSTMLDFIAVGGAGERHSCISAYLPSPAVFPAPISVHWRGGAGVHRQLLPGHSHCASLRVFPVAAQVLCQVGARGAWWWSSRAQRSPLHPCRSNGWKRWRDRRSTLTLASRWLVCPPSAASTRARGSSVSLGTTRTSMAEPTPPLSSPTAGLASASTF
jgi:ABC-type multidrug transport system fused ATPase/permease subunit